MVYVPPKYPNAIPTPEDLPDRQDDVHWITAARYNELKKELRAALIELGTLPKGEYADVKTRLDAAAIGDKISEGDSSVEVIDTNGDGHVDIKTENVLCGKYHSDGIHDLPKQSRCRVYKSAVNQTIPDSIPTKLVLDGVTYDNQNEFDKDVNYRFTAKKGGKYQINATLDYYPTVAGKSYFTYINKNGVNVNICRLHSSSTGVATPNVSDIIELDANDWIDIWTEHIQGSNSTVRKGENLTNCSIHKLS